jgi:hypothetical protein
MPEGDLTNTPGPMISLIASIGDRQILIGTLNNFSTMSQSDPLGVIRTTGVVDNYVIAPGNGTNAARKILLFVLGEDEN